MDGDAGIQQTCGFATAVAGFIGGGAHRSFRFSRTNAAGDTPMLLGLCHGMLETRGGQDRMQTVGAQSEKAVPVRAHRFGAGPEYSLGIEEELMLLDAEVLP